MMVTDMAVGEGVEKTGGERSNACYTLNKDENL